MVIKLDAHNLEKHFQHTQRPVLVGYFCKDHDLRSHMQLLEEVHTFFENKMDVFFMEANSFRAFGHYHHIGGTPTFLAFHEGREQGRLLGKATIDEIIAFVKRTLPRVEQPMAASAWYRCNHV